MTMFLFIWHFTDYLLVRVTSYLMKFMNETCYQISWSSLSEIFYLEGKSCPSFLYIEHQKSLHLFQLKVKLEMIVFSPISHYIEMTRWWVLTYYWIVFQSFSTDWPIEMPINLLSHNVWSKSTKDFAQSGETLDWISSDCFESFSPLSNINCSTMIFFFNLCLFS